MTLPTIAIAATPLAPIPAKFTMSTNEKLNFSLDMTPLLQVGQTVQSAATTLTKLEGRGTTVTIPAPAVASPTITQLITGSTELTAGLQFILEFLATLNDGTIWEQDLTIICPR